MEIGYYWAYHTGDKRWSIVLVADRLPDHVMMGGYAWPRDQFKDYTGPLRPPDGQLYPEDLATNKDLRAELEEATTNYKRACATIAAMHEAAMGEVCGSKRGVVEDVADLRAERDGLVVALVDFVVQMERIKDNMESVLRQLGVKRDTNHD